MKQITMTYIEVLEKMIERKRAEFSKVADEVSMAATSTSKKKFVELESEIRTCEYCLDLAKVMFDGKKEDAGKDSTGK